MSDILTITANWATGSLSNSVLSRQYDNNRYRVEFMGYPESISEDLHFYLLVWMKADKQSPARGLAPIELDSDQWVITNYFTQLVQPIRFQLCVKDESGDFEAHSPIFSGSVADSLEHDGESQDINIKGLFDKYREYVNELILLGGEAQVDDTLTISGAAADAKAVGDALAEKADADDVTSLGARVTALESGADGGLTADIKSALLACFRNVAWINDDGQDYYDALYDALYPTIKSIEATFNQGSAIIYDSAEINSLKRYLTVVAVNSDDTEIVLSRSDYNLSGNLEAGVSTITVEYGTATTTFTANITEDTLQSITATHDGRTVYSDRTLDDIRVGLVVTAKTASGGSVIVPESDYTLTGDLVAGQCTFIIEYNNLTTSIDITVTQAPDYTKDALENVTWTSGYRYDGQTGEIKAVADQHITDRFKVQACMYDVLPDLTGVSFVAFYMWDSNGNYIGFIEDVNLYKHMAFNPSYEYAICLYSKNNVDWTKATLIPVDNRATASQTIILNLSELTLAQFNNKNVAQYDVTAILQNYGITINNLRTKFMGCNVVPFFVNKDLANTVFGGSFDDLVVSLFPWQGVIQLSFKKAGITSQSDFENYVSANNIKIVLN